MPLLKRQKQEVWELLTRWEVEPGEFEWSVFPDGDILRHRDEDCFFLIGPPNHNGYFDVAYQPGLSQYRKRERASGWPDAKRYLSTWAKAIVAERKSIDPWRVVAALQTLLDEDEDEDPEDNSPYSSAQQADFLEMLRELEGRVEALASEQSQSNAELRLYLARQFEVVREALPVKGRREWKRLLRDFLVNISATLTLQVSPGAASAALELGQGLLRAIQ